MVIFTYDKLNKLIIIPKTWYMANGYQVTIQQLINDIRDFEDNDEGMDIPRIAEAAGKQDLGGGVLVGITMTLYDWKIKFEDYGTTPCSTTVACNITGGNLVCYNTVSQLYVNPIEPSNCITVTLTASSSATLQELGAIQYSSFDGGVWIDQANGDSGTDYPAGTPQQPVDNITDAKSIAEDRGFDTFYIIGNLTLTASDNISGYTIIGSSQDKTDIYLQQGCTVDNCEFESASISGSLGGSVVNFFDCRLEHNVYNLVNGYMRNCILAGTLSISGAEVVDILSCYSGVPGSETPYIDFQGTPADLGLRGYAGGITLLNMTHSGNNVSIDMLSGRGKLDYSCVSGSVMFRGVGKLLDPSGNIITTGTWNGAVNVINESIARGTVTSVIHEGTVQSATNSTITLATNASSIDGAYDPALITITNGTGVGQSRGIYQYDGSTKIAIIDRNWKQIPDTTSNYAITSWPGREHVHEGLTQAATETTITLNPLASSDDDAYIRQTIFLRAGTGDDQVRLITDYDGTTKIATIDTPWTTIPDTTTSYVMIPSRNPSEETITIPIWDTVYIDTINGTAGTSFPIGTAGTPVNCISSARMIADDRGINKITVNGTIHLDQEYDGWIFDNDSPYLGRINLSGQSTVNAVFTDLTISGQCSGSIHATHCHFDGVKNLEGFFHNCNIMSDIGLKPGGRNRFVGGTTLGTTGINIDVSGTGWISMTNYTGRINVKNMTSPASLFAMVGFAEVILDPSITAGYIFAAEGTIVTDNATSYTSFTDNTIWKQVWEEPMANHTTFRSFGSGLKHIFEIERGGWLRSGSQMTFYDASGNLIGIFDLKQADGSPAGETDDVYERTRA